jgi:hypothetical protein
MRGESVAIVLAVGLDWSRPPWRDRHFCPKMISTMTLNIVAYDVGAALGECPSRVDCWPPENRFQLNATSGSIKEKQSREGLDMSPPRFI